MNKSKDLKEGIAKKDMKFALPSEGYESFFSPKKATTKKKRPGRPRTSTKVITKGNTPEDGTRYGERRITYILKKEIIDKIEDVAYWERKMIKEVVSEALMTYIEAFEKDHGKINPKPKKQ